MSLRKKPFKIFFCLLFLYCATVKAETQIPAASSLKTSIPNTPDWISTARPWAEMVFFASNILTLFIALYGAQQVRILKEDLRIRSRRAACEKAAEYAAIFADSVVIRREFIRDCEKNTLPLYDGKISDFDVTVLDNKWKDIVEKKYKLDSSVQALNQMELIAMAFISRVADDQAGFDALGRGFCANVAVHYDIFTESFAKGFFQNVVKLYRTWWPRIQKSDLDKQKFDLTKQVKTIQARAATIPDRIIPPLDAD